MNIEKNRVLVEPLDLSPCGSILVALHFQDRHLVRIELGVNTAGAPSHTNEQHTIWLKKLLCGMALEKFPLPFKLMGTPFQKRIWHTAMRIGHGQTCTYADLAKAAGCGSPRAVGQALKRNPLPIIVPCHRVVGKGGRLTGFSAGLHIKKILLEYERIVRDENSNNE